MQADTQLAQSSFERRVPFYGLPDQEELPPLPACLPLPTELAAHIFSFLSSEERRDLPLTCRDWRNLLQSDVFLPPEFLLPLKEFWLIHNLPGVKEVQKLALIKKTFAAPFQMLHRRKGLCLVATKKDDRFYLLDLAQGTAKKGYLRKALNEIEAASAALKDQTIAGGAILRKDKVVTASVSGTLTVWDVTQKKIEHESHEQTLNPEQWKEKGFRFKKNPVLRQLLTTKDQLFLEGFGQAEALDSDLHPTPAEADTPFQDRTNGSHLFKGFFHQNNLCAKITASYRNEKKEDEQTYAIDFDNSALIGMMPNWQGSFSGVNDRWLILSFYGYDGQPEPEPMKHKGLQVIEIFDVTKGAHFWQLIVPDMLPHPWFDGYLGNANLWLSDDYLILANGSQLMLWHVPTKIYLATVSLQKKEAAKNQVSIIWSGFFDGQLLALKQREKGSLDLIKIPLHTSPTENKTYFLENLSRQLRLLPLQKKCSQLWQKARNPK
ncbi:MAG: hypothetical protein K0S07_1071 [Chlamydiales bacterium]|jgi:hypothetical protein|nr:hypothetical protein [Chlamydiales bacterium]